MCPFTRSLDDRRFRSNPGFDRVAVHELPPDDRSTIESIAGRNVWAVLRCKQTQEYVTAIDHETAFLVDSLATPRTLPAFLGRLSGQTRYRLVARLVCDQVIQIEQHNGSFVD
jgi:hypothetical protein